MAKKKKASAAAPAADDTNNKEDAADVSKRTAQRTRMQLEFDTLHQEMEIAQYGTTATGQLRKKLPRHQSAARTQKRKILEKQDEQEQAEAAGGGGGRKRLRGPRAAAEEDVIQGSLIFGSQAVEEEPVEQAEDAEEPSEAEGESDQVNDNENDGGDDGEDSEEDAEVEEPEEEQDEQDEDQDDVEDADDTPRKPAAVASKPKKKTTTAKPRKKRNMHRLKNFTSQRMARRHGDALGAHARGMPKVAIQKLKEIAREVPSASQVYSSLGMVYEDMLRESRKKYQESQAETGVTKEVVAAEDDQVADKILAEQLDLAKKAYGSYHVAAILCKKDYTLWVRAADSAVEIADLHTLAMELPGTVDNVRHFQRLEKSRWLSEAKSDYKVADNLKPPGIDVPAKLASALMELGSLAEALTLLTDLKNTRPTDTEYSEFESSYKAWLLYADLMLKIGHECNEWNSGNRSNDNFMFRRWLRKLSTSFDWGERRLQALSKALETAAGSTSTLQYVGWLQKRAVSIGEHAEKDPESKNDSTGVPGVGESNRGPTGAIAKPSSATEAPVSEQFEEEKSLLLKRNQSDLHAFDKTTVDMALESGSIPAKQREGVRAGLISSHKADIVELVGEYHQSQPAGIAPAESSIESGMEQSPETSSKSILPPSASCATVYRIASELMRYLLDAKLYIGARLVGDTVSLYLKGRAVSLDKRLQARHEYENVQNRPTSIFAFQNAAYDAVDDNSDGDESDVPLSDSDELEEMYETSNVQSSLQRGILPPDLRVLYGLTLVAEGGRNFVAAKCLDSLEALDYEPRSWWVDSNSWLMYHRAMTGPLGRTAAYALTFSVLRAVDKEEEMARHLGHLFTTHFELLREEGELEASLKMGNDCTEYDIKYYASKAIMASLKFQILDAEMQVRQDDPPNSKSVGDTVVKVMPIVDLLIDAFPSVWKVETNASVADEAVEMLGVLARAFAVLLNDVSKDSEQQSLLTDRTRKVQALASRLCGIRELDVLSSSTSRHPTEDSTTKLTGIPFPTSWLSPEHDRIVLRTYNLCIAANVSLFSGWEDQEFSLRLLRHRDVDNFFGLTMHDEKVAGYLGPSLENELVEQWTLLNPQLPKSCSFNYGAQLQSLRSTPWYTGNESKHKSLGGNSISSFGEDAGLSILLSFSRSCLLLVAETDDQSRKDRLLFTAMSILLPMSQFSLDQKLWDPKIGKEATENATVDRLEHATAKQVEETLDEIHGRAGDGDLMYKNGTLSRPKEKETATRSGRRTHANNRPRERTLHEFFGGENDDSHLINLVSLPCSTLQQAWAAVSKQPASSEAATQAMQKLQTHVEELRSCFTEQSVEKSSLQVASALVELVPFSRNPFLSMQQAALFASQASKGGNSKAVFKVPLPRQDECTPLQALTLLGRADCLQAIYFCPEAAFLCSFVAIVCGRHRNPAKRVLEWNEQWKIVSVMAYNVSVMIRYTALTILQEHDKRDEISLQWELDVVEELKRGRSDGISWMALLPGASAAAAAAAAAAISHQADHFVPENNPADVVGDALGSSDALFNPLFDANGILNQLHQPPSARMDHAESSDTSFVAV